MKGKPALWEGNLADYLEPRDVAMTPRIEGWFYQQQRLGLLSVKALTIHSARVVVTALGRQKAAEAGR